MSVMEEAEPRTKMLEVEANTRETMLMRRAREGGELLNQVCDEGDQAPRSDDGDEGGQAPHDNVKRWKAPTFAKQCWRWRGPSPAQQRW